MIPLIELTDANSNTKVSLNPTHIAAVVPTTPLTGGHHPLAKTAIYSIGVQLQVKETYAQVRGMLGYLEIPRT